MRVSDFLDHLTLGELKQVAVGGFADYGKVQPGDNKELIQHINLGLLQLYTRFPLRERELLVNLSAGKELYPLESQFAYSSGNLEWYIDDTLQPFTDDIIRIQTVWVGKTEVPVNNEPNPHSVYLPSYKCIQIPWAEDDITLSIIYRAEPPTVAELTDEIPLPDTMTEALLSYVEFRVRKSMGGESHVALAMAARQQYESLVQAIEAGNLLNTADNFTCVKPAMRGFV